jgi:polar amino acid transport system permease protein
VLGAIVGFLALTGPQNGWQWHRIWGDAERPGYRHVFLEGLGTTLFVSLGALGVALVLGFAGGLARLSRRPWLSQLGAIYVEVVRGTPLLVQIFIAVYCLGYALGIARETTLLGVLTLGTFAGAYVTEIVRGAVESIETGQTEAALSQGMTRGQVLRHVLLPQAFRRMLPPMTGEFVSLVKDSSLLSVLGVLELTKRANEVNSVVPRPFEIYFPLALLYLASTFPLSRLARRLELRRASA